MQKAVAKYGLAAHLALLAVAPLFLFPFFGSGTTAAVLLWLCLFAALWLVLSPSLLNGEMLREARKRLLSGIVRDPVFWILAAVVVIAGFRALNTGIRISFDYETSTWAVLPPVVPFLPGSVAGSGALPFAGTLSAAIAVLGCRHALGKSARMMFLLVLSVLSGLAALVALFLFCSGNAAVELAATVAPERFSTPGLGFALCLLCSMVALFAALERDWNRSLLLLVVAVVGDAIGAFLFLPPRDSIAVALAYAVLLLVSVFSAWISLSMVKGFRFLIVVLVSLGLAYGIVDVCLTDEALEGKISAFEAMEQTSADRDKVRDVLSDVASKAWSENIWTGVGVGAFQFQPRFHLSQDELDALPSRVHVVPNVWWQLLAERGAVGMVMVALPLLFLLFSYFAGVFRCVFRQNLPSLATALAPIAVAVVVFSAFCGVSMLRAEVLTIFGAILVISSKSFPKGDSNV